MVTGRVCDPLAPSADEPFLAQERDRAPVTHGIPVICAEALIYMKLKTWRMRDRVDVVELVKSGVEDLERCRTG